MEKDEKLMYRSLEGPLPPGDEQKLRKALETSDTLHEKYRRAIEIRESAAAENTDFSPWFEAKVMHAIEKISAIDIQSTFPLRFYKTATLVGVATIAAMLIITLIFNGSLSINSVMGLDSITSENLTAFIAFDF